MIVYVEASFCLQTGAAGWGACLAAERGDPLMANGEVLGEMHKMITMAELCAVRAAVEHFAGQKMLPPETEVTIAMRSTAALAVLRWVFPDAQFSGKVHVEPPKRLGQFIKDAQCLYDLHDVVEARQLKVRLMHVGLCRETGEAQRRAREEMELARLGVPR